MNELERIAIDEILRTDVYKRQVVADGDSIGTYYISEKVWDVA